MAEPEQVPESHESQEVTEEQQPSTEPTLQSSESPSQGRVKIITESENDSEKEEKQEIPTVPGLTSMIDQWQIAGVPEQNHFFSLQENMLDAAIQAIKARLDERDGNIRQYWLLTEVDHWDLEKERIVILTDNNIISVKYNFIVQQVEELKYIPINWISSAVTGEFTYPSSYGFKRRGNGLKIYWNNSSDHVGFFTRWNPFSNNVPYTTFASHLLVRRRRINNSKLEITTFPQELEKAINDFRARVKNSGEGGGNSASSSDESAADFKITEGPLVVDHYLGVSAMVHNQSFMGFFKKRGAINW